MNADFLMFWEAMFVTRLNKIFNSKCHQASLASGGLIGGGGGPIADLVALLMF